MTLEAIFDTVNPGTVKAFANDNGAVKSSFAPPFDPINPGPPRAFANVADANKQVPAPIFDPINPGIAQALLNVPKVTPAFGYIAPFALPTGPIVAAFANTIF